MPLKNIQLCHIDRVTIPARRPSEHDTSVWEVTAWSDDQRSCVRFRCKTEADGLALRNSIRENAAQLRRVDDFDR